MSDEQEITDSIDTTESPTENLSVDSTINPTDDENLFIYDDDSERLTCVGSTFDDIPQNIIDTYASRAKVNENFFLIPRRRDLFI